MSGISGVAAARTIRSKDRNAAIVFTTSSPDYYADGFAVGAVHYLLKPFNKSDIYEALDRCLRQVGQAERYIELTVNREVCRILLSDLLWAESRGQVRCRTGKTDPYRGQFKGTRNPGQKEPEYKPRDRTAFRQGGCREV